MEGGAAIIRPLHTCSRLCMCRVWCCTPSRNSTCNGGQSGYAFHSSGRGDYSCDLDSEPGIIRCVWPDAGQRAARPLRLSCLARRSSSLVCRCSWHWCELMTAWHRLELLLFYHVNAVGTSVQLVCGEWRQEDRAFLTANYRLCVV